MLYCGRLWLVLEQVERRNVGQKESKSGFLSVSNFFFFFLIQKYINKYKIKDIKFFVCLIFSLREDP